MRTAPKNDSTARTRYIFPNGFKAEDTPTCYTVHSCSNPNSPEALKDI